MQRLGFALIVGALGIVCLLARHWIITQNERHYGVSVTTEISEPEFRRAFRNLTRLDANRHHPYVPVTREAMAAAARVSPGFREVMPVLEEQLDGKGWSRHGCEWMGICREIAGGWMVWAFRDAAAQVGKYVDARTARAFYSGIADDIEAACSAGRIECSFNPTGNILAPPLQPVDAWRILSSCGRVLWMAVWMPGLGEGIAAVERLPSGLETTQAYRWLKGDRIGAEAAPLYRFGPQIVWVYRGIHVLGGAVDPGGADRWGFRMVFPVPETGHRIVHAPGGGCVVLRRHCQPNASGGLYRRHELLGAASVHAAGVSGADRLDGMHPLAVDHLEVSSLLIRRPSTARAKPFTMTWMPRPMAVVAEITIRRIC